MVRLLLVTSLLLLLAGAAVAGWMGWVLTRPLPLAESTVIEVEPGSSLARTVRRLADAGMLEHPETLRVWGRVSGAAGRIRAGEYRIDPGTSALGLLDEFVKGRAMRRHFTIVEGWRFEDLRRALARAERLVNDSAELSDDQIMARLGRAELPPEGRFFPDTYDYLAGTSDLVVLGRALERMERTLDEEWRRRAYDLPFSSADEALVLASIIEKETGLAADREKVAGVFVRRLELGMRLQTDPTVIYGLGDAFEGPLTRTNLRTPTPWNTYVHHGLPPTPIAMPGRAALRAALHPDTTDALYFVARGDGSSEFSATLEDHNRAVRRYLRGGGDRASSNDSASTEGTTPESGS